MVRSKEIQEKLLHLIGWEQHYDTTSELRIANSLTESQSGLYFQQVHPLLTLQNLNCIAPDFKNEYQYADFSADVTYDKGFIVLHGGKLYKSLADNNLGHDPKAEANYWELTSLFSEWLESKTKGSIQKLISRYYNEKIIQKTAKQLCERKVLFDGTGRLVDTVNNRNNLVGFEIVPIRSMGVTTKINKIGLQFTEPGEYTLYLMHSSSSTPIRTLTFIKLYRNTMEWFNIDDLYLPYRSSEIDAGGSWYLCYFQSDLPNGSKAIRKDYDWSKGPCKGCSRLSYIAWQAWSKFLEVHPFYIKEELVDAVHFNDDFNDDFSKQAIHLWDISDNTYTYDTNYGINLEVSVECDMTDFIIEQKELFVDAISKQLAIDLLREFAYNPNVRTNRHSINASRTDILYELDGDSSSMKKSGLSYQLEQALAALKLNTSGLDRICMPCNNNGIKYRPI